MEGLELGGPFEMVFIKVGAAPAQQMLGIFDQGSGLVSLRLVDIFILLRIIEPGKY
jgi:hypothetical protein